MARKFNFYGAHRSGLRYQAEEGNRRLVEERCAPIVVTAKELSEAVDEQGVSPWRAQELVYKLLARAQQEAVARTLGLEVL